MKKHVSVFYVDTEKTFEVEERNLLGDVFPSIPRGIPEEQQVQAVVAALDNPIGSKPLNELVEPNTTISLLSDDWTRPTPVYRIMPVVIGRLLSYGVKEKNIRIIVARGTHGPLSREQMSQKLGSEIIERFPVENHNPDENLTQLGTSKRGTPVSINSSFLKADVNIARGGWWLTRLPDTVAEPRLSCPESPPGQLSTTTIRRPRKEASPLALPMATRYVKTWRR